MDGTIISTFLIPILTVTTVSNTRETGDINTCQAEVFVIKIF